MKRLFSISQCAQGTTAELETMQPAITGKSMCHGQHISQCTKAPQCWWETQLDLKTYLIGFG